MFPGDIFMHKKYKTILLALVMCVILPAILIRTVQTFSKDSTQSTEQTQPQMQTDDTLPTEVTDDVFYIPVLLEDGKLLDMELDVYITGVVLAEMPADFENEALKAQAVVARTYALKRYFSQEKHTGGAVCTNPACCQAYCSEEDFLSSGGTRIALDKVNNAVKLTEKKVLTYHSELIDATYFSCSGGKTEDAKAVWGTDVPYLQSVSSPGEEKAAHYMDTVFFTLQEFADCLLISDTSLKGAWIGEITYTEGGGVESITICDRTYTGTQLRSLLGLRSTAFVITAVGNTVTVTTKGFGHRVGMSQYGADAMALSGSTYEEILCYYYQGAVVEEFAV